MRPLFSVGERVQAELSKFGADVSAKERATYAGTHIGTIIESHGRHMCIRTKREQYHYVLDCFPDLIVSEVALRKLHGPSTEPSFAALMNTLNKERPLVRL